MCDLKIQKIWEFSYQDFYSSGHPQSDVQRKASLAVLNCRSGRLGYSVSQCTESGHIEIHSNSCRNRNCLNCQAVSKVLWVDKRRAEVIDTPYFHVVFTLPHDLNPLLYSNQELLGKDWCPYIKETFNGFGNAIEYLGRYTHKIAISNSRILSVTEAQTTFSARGKKPGDPKRIITLDNTEFIRRFLMHVLPKGFRKIRYYGFLNNHMKSKNLRLIFTLQGRQRFRRRYAGLSIAELLKAVWDMDIRVCPACGCAGMRPLGRTYACRC